MLLKQFFGPDTLTRHRLDQLCPVNMYTRACGRGNSTRGPGIRCGLGRGRLVGSSSPFSVRWQACRQTAFAMWVLASHMAMQSAKVLPPPPGRDCVVAVPPPDIAVSSGGANKATVGTFTGEGALATGGVRSGSEAGAADVVMVDVLAVDAAPLEYCEGIGQLRGAEGTGPPLAGR